MDEKEMLSEEVATLQGDIAEGLREIRRLRRELEFYKIRVEELERHKYAFPQPYYAMICDILANGRVGEADGGVGSYCHVIGAECAYRHRRG